MTEVLQINVRLSEGGAAGVARTLHDGLRARGIGARFAYGYAKGGGPSPLETEYEALRLASAPRAALNLAAHQFVGTELVNPARSQRASLLREVRKSDVVHLHAIHSYMMPPLDLLALIADEGKPIVWTMHDQWVMTGRCAQPGTCRGWEGGCDPCPFLSAYPPAKIDRAASMFVARRTAMDEVRATVPLKMVACASWLADEMEAGGFSDVSTITNSVDPQFWSLAQEQAPGDQVDGQARFLFMCRDLRDRAKVDWDLLEEIARIAPGRLTIVGDNAPSPIANALMLGAITERAEMYRLMREHTHLVFSSAVDYYPLTIVEALTAGMSVVAADSRAAREFGWSKNVTIVGERSRWAEAIDSAVPLSPISPAEVTHFSPDRMIDDYVGLYESLAQA
ncbi:glycosyltransferase [Curtobacterium flaccumfaciens]|uniref:glycosyltransferase n=1 Tax=Curtobacterium flaccumfaciens TaxID=2035 RepID=UPI0039947B15